MCLSILLQEQGAVKSNNKSTNKYFLNNSILQAGTLSLIGSRFEKQFFQELYKNILKGLKLRH